jgi:hypothetical protein
MNQRCLEIVTEINEIRLSNNQQLLWPDYEILRHLIRFKNNDDEMYEYCNMLKLKIITFKSSDNLLEATEIV